MPGEVCYCSFLFVLGFQFWVLLLLKTHGDDNKEEKKEEKYTTVISISPYYIHAIVITLYHKLVQSGRSIVLGTNVYIEVLS